MTKYSMSSWLDESTPPLDDLLKGVGIDAQQFKSWLGEKLGNYRFLEKHKFPSASKEKAELKKYIQALKTIEHYLSTPTKLPPVVRGLILSEMVESDMYTSDAEKNLYHDILRRRVIAEEVQSQIARQGSEKGRPSNLARNRLLSEIANRLEEAGATRTESREIAEQILIRAKISVPSDERTLRRVHSKGGHK